MMINIITTLMGRGGDESEESRIKHNIVKYCLINEAKYIKTGDLLTCTSTAPFFVDH